MCPEDLLHCLVVRFGTQSPFQDMVLPNNMLSAIVSKVGADNAIYVPSLAEVEQLKEANQQLRSENAKLKLFSSGEDCDECCMSCTLRTSDVQMRVAIRFELLPRRSSDLGKAAMVRQASFQDLNKSAPRRSC